MNSDIGLMDRERLQEEVARLRAAIRSFCDSSDAKRLPEAQSLISLLPQDAVSTPAPKLPRWDELLGDTRCASR